MTVVGACWVKQTPDAFWNLWVFARADDKPALLAAYSDLAGALSSDSVIKLSRLRVVPATDFAAEYLDLARKVVPDGRALELPAETLKPLGWHQAILYPKLGPMNVAEIAAFLAGELNRSGEAIAVTLTLADGRNVRGFPLAIRKSTIGGAFVELADPETRLKGHEIPLDRISSIVSDFLAS